VQPPIVKIEDLLALHPINVSVLLPFLVERLRSVSLTNQTLVTFLLNGITSPDEKRHDVVTLLWKDTKASSSIFAVGEQKTTELAASCIAAFACCYYAGLRFLSVIEEEDNVLYRVGRSENETYTLRVIGTLTERVTTTSHREKVSGILRDDRQRNDLLVVVSFSRDEVITSFIRCSTTGARDNKTIENELHTMTDR
jgi:hypothetical protein